MFMEIKMKKEKNHIEQTLEFKLKAHESISYSHKATEPLGAYEINIYALKENYYSISIKTNIIHEEMISDYYPEVIKREDPSLTKIFENLNPLLKKLAASNYSFKVYPQFSFEFSFESDSNIALLNFIELKIAKWEKFFMENLGA